MSNFIDLKMEYKDKKGYYDLDITDTGDLQRDDTFDTTLNCSILTDGRADKSEVSQVELQRGTIVDIFTPKRNGSKLWLLGQARLDLSSKNRAVDYVKNSLQFLKDEGYCRNVLVKSKLTSKGIALTITIERLNGVFDDYRYDTWQNSIYRM